jgi:hypothetical protein
VKTDRKPRSDASHASGATWRDSISLAESVPTSTALFRLDNFQEMRSAAEKHACNMYALAQKMLTK